MPGRLKERADALSRRDQDMPKGKEDERLADRKICLLKSDVLVASHNIINSENTSIEPEIDHFKIGELPDELKEWNEELQEDEAYKLALEAVREGASKFPTELQLKVSISECSRSK
ncbi:hypothetical protein K3495_g3814 [Podosphaera aphanis]|nr:hypothetical protein K3495_g3814 [Podosphaera aphanis]